MSLTVGQVSARQHPSYASSTNGVVSSGTSLNTVTSIAYLFNSSSSLKLVEINKILISFAAGSGGLLQIRGAFITSENVAPGGTSQPIHPKDLDDPASALIFRTGASEPVRLAGDLITFAPDVTNARLKWEVGRNTTKPIVLRPGIGEGFEIRSVIGVALNTPQLIAVSYEWTEIDV